MLFLMETKLEAAATKSGTETNIQCMHELLGHRNEETTRKIAKLFVLSIKCGSMSPCDGCDKCKNQAEECNKIKLK